MIKPRKKEIDALRRKIAKLEAQEAREADIRETVGKILKDLKASLKKEGITLEEFVRAGHREFSRVMERIAAAESISTPKKRGRKKKAKKRAGRKSKAATIKIPAGKYSNIPPDTKAVFVVNERGPRPKLLKAHAEKLGLEQFLKTCKK